MTHMRRLTILLIVCGFGLAVTVVDIFADNRMALAVMAVGGWISAIVNAAGWRAAHNQIDEAKDSQ
jgi:hypothetical protein